MHFSSSMRLFLLAASAVIPGSTAFVAPNAWTPRGIAVVPPSGPQPQTSTSLNVGKIMDAAKLVSKVDHVLKRLDDVSHLDPEEDGDEKTKEILDLTLDVLKVVGSKKFAEEVEVAEEELGKDSAIGKAIDLVETLINYSIEYANPDQMEYTTYPAHPEYPTVSLVNMPKMTAGEPPLYMVWNARKIARFIRTLLDNKITQRIVSPKAFEFEEEDNTEEAFKHLFSKSRLFLGLIPNKFQFIPPPQYAIDNWEDDSFQGRQFLNGVNPVMIKVAKELGDFSEEIANELGKDELQKLIDEKRLFYVSYDELAEFEPAPGKNPHQAFPLPMNKELREKEPKRIHQPRFFDPAIAVFTLSEDRMTLVPKAIQLSREENAKVYTKDNASSPSEWLLVKAKLQTADSQYHEWVSHLGMTHLATEPHILAIYNTLKAKDHPLHTFLKPCMKDTLLLNYLARTPGNLAGHGERAFGDETTSVGVGQFMQLIQKKWQSYDFFESGLPHELESRGFTEDFDMPLYLFREDGMKLWNAYGTFATDFVNELYNSDEELAADETVQLWARETSYADKAAVPGFPTSFTDRATLVKALQTIMWMTSGLHCAVNFPQADFFGYGPNKPLGAREPIENFPSGEDEKTKRAWIFNKFMPTIEAQQKVVTTTKLLTLESEHTINRLDKNFEKVGTESYKKFKAVTEEIGKGIEKRNKANSKKGLPEYHYLHPDVVSVSIDI